MILWGDIREFPLFTVLQFLAGQRRTGVLEIQDFEEQGEVYLDSGRLQAVSLLQGDEEFGKRLVKSKMLTEAEVKECWMRWSNGDVEGAPLMAYLLDIAHADLKKLVPLVDRHTSNQVMQLMYWKSGTFRFVLPEKPVTFRAVPSLTVENLLLDAYRRVDEGERPAREKAVLDEEICASCTIDCNPAVKARYLKPDVCLWRSMPSILKDPSFSGNRRGGRKVTEEEEDPGPDDLGFI